LPKQFESGTDNAKKREKPKFTHTHSGLSEIALWLLLLLCKYLIHSFFARQKRKNKRIQKRED